MFVMGGAVVVAFFGYQLVFRRDRPVFEPSFNVPTSKLIDTKLVAGSAVFGIGWGIAGFCPGAALPVLGTGNGDVVTFLVALVVGIMLARGLMRLNLGSSPGNRVSNN